MGWSVKLVCMAGVRTGVHVFAICVKTGIPKMRNTLCVHVYTLNIYGTSSTIYSIIFLKVISKVLFFNITHLQLISAAVDLFDWIFVGTYKFSSHARLEAFVIQTKLNNHKKDEHPCQAGGRLWSSQGKLYFLLVASHPPQFFAQLLEHG